MGCPAYSKTKKRDRTCGCPFHCMLLSPSRVHLYSCAIGFELCQRGKVVIIFRQVRVEDRTIMFRHGKGAMPQEFLQSKGIAATINQILSGKGVAEQMDACLLDTPPRIIPCYGLPQTVLRQLRAGFRAKEVVPLCRRYSRRMATMALQRGMTCAFLFFVWR